MVSQKQFEKNFDRLLKYPKFVLLHYLALQDKIDFDNLDAILRDYKKDPKMAECLED
jgi:hypothetical protein